LYTCQLLLAFKTKELDETNDILQLILHGVL
jgi:hypothetical protein